MSRAVFHQLPNVLCKNRPSRHHLTERMKRAIDSPKGRRLYGQPWPRWSRCLSTCPQYLPISVTPISRVAGDTGFAGTARPCQAVPERRC